MTHEGGPLVVLGAAGSGKTTVLVERALWLVEQGLAPDALLVLSHAAPAADALREAIEPRIRSPYAQLHVTTFASFATTLLRDEAVEAGLDPFAVPVSTADRVAMLLERMDELPLREHDLRGNPSTALATIVQRIDRLKEELVSASAYAAWADGLPRESEADRSRAERERELAAIYAAHDRMLGEAGMLDAGDLLLHAHALLTDRPHVCRRIAARHRHVLVDELQDASFAQLRLLRALVEAGSTCSAAGDDDQAIHRYRGAAAKNLRELRAWPGATEIRLAGGQRMAPRIARAAHALVTPSADRLAAEHPEGDEPAARAGAERPGGVAFWRCASERAQAQAVAADVERLIARGELAPERIAILVRSVKNEGQAVALALEERAVPYRLTGAAAFFQRAEVRDLIAWLRLLIDPGDAGAVVRALARAPIELRSIDLARCTQIARRRKLDMVSALGAALESPQVPPEARDRIRSFLRLYRSASGALDSSRPDLYVHRLIERLGLRRQLLFAASTQAVEQLVNLAKLGELASAYVRRAPQATARDFAHSITAVADAGLREEEAQPAAGGPAVQVMSIDAAKAREFDAVYVLGLISSRMPGPRRRAPEEAIPDALLAEQLPPATREAHIAEARRLLHVAVTRARERLVLAYPERTERGGAQHPSPFAEEALAALGGAWEERSEELFGPAETLQSAFRMLRDELMTTVSQTGGRLGELRFDTDLDVSHAVVRYLELLKLAALLERPQGQPVADALAGINERLKLAVTAEQREIFETSALDDYLLDAERDERARSAAVARRAEPSLDAFLPRRGDGLLLSASDIDTYRTCPLKYKFARVFRIPQEPTINQRFGILVHQVLERFHAGETPTHSLAELLGLLEAGWRRGGFGSSEEERQLHEKATTALIRYHERFQGEEAEPVWFEKSFTFKLGAHVLRGRVDRVDRLPDGSYELIDYKTGRPKSAAQLREDVQLALYAVAARESWRVDSSQQAYYYVLDDEKVPVPHDDDVDGWIEELVLTVADGILGQGFEPTPSWSACSMCDYRIACPAAER